MLIEEPESNQFELIKNAKIRYWVYNVGIPISLICFFYLSYLSYHSIREHKAMINYEPVRSGILLEHYNLENRKVELGRILKYNSKPELHIELALTFERIDSIKVSEEYRKDSIAFTHSSLAFVKVENKLSIVFILQVLGALLSGFIFIWLVKSFYFTDILSED